jgi:Icc-related predicted phosphoesterase
MIIQPFSDLHVDFKDYKIDYPVHPEADLVVYAGDVGENINKNFAWMDKQLNGKEAVYILGNHEFYSGKYHKKIKLAQERAKDYPNIHFLHNGTIDIGGYTIFGSTLWTDFNKGDAHAMWMARTYMMDYKAITWDKGGYRKLLPRDVFAEHTAARNKLQQVLKTNHPVIVVTHHAPHELSIDNKYKNDQLNDSYFSNLDSFIVTYQPKLWIHGHMHDAKHYKIEQTAVVCNPGGYPGEIGRNGFNAKMLLKV